MKLEFQHNPQLSGAEIVVTCDNLVIGLLHSNWSSPHDHWYPNYEISDLFIPEGSVFPKSLDEIRNYMKELIEKVPSVKNRVRSYMDQKVREVQFPYDEVYP